MLIIYIKFKAFEYFECDNTRTVAIPDKIETSGFDITKHDYIVGNNLQILDITTQVCIDVCQLGLDYITLEKYGLEAIVYAYNMWYIPSCLYMLIDVPYYEYLVRNKPSDAKYTKVKLLTGSRRFDQISHEVKMASKSANFIGAIWPTCHYKADTSYMWLIYGGRINTIRQLNYKPVNK